jgi:uncharacterized protein (DUF1800 family)
MPLYQCQPPTGYRDTADAWTNAGALVARMNFSLAFARNAVLGVRANLERDAPGLAHPGTLVLERILGGGVSDSTRTTVARAETVAQAVALTLGSPEFQKR